MGAFASAPARVADAGVLRYAKEIEVYCGKISAEQEEILARSKFIGGEEEDEGEEAEVVITPPLIRPQNEDLIPQVEQGVKILRI